MTSPNPSANHRISPPDGHPQVAPISPIGRRQLRAASAPAPARPAGPRCNRCDRGPAHPLEAIDMTAQWLIATPEGPQLRCFCRDCRPDGPVSDLTCQRCGDGPLLVGDLAAHSDGTFPAPVRDWLTATGWHATAPAGPRGPDGLTCPDCRRGARR